ncbi:NAD(P)-dependent oxidoreductase [Synechococcus sp. AH-224-G16]|nr:NAD(P)-dependent oxidoreductase [Synechococcus sp. AH-224-G16]
MFLRSPRLLLTGYSGLVGRSLARILQTRGIYVVGLSRTQDASSCLTVPEAHTCDLSSQDEVLQFISNCEPCDYIVHLAANTKFSDSLIRLLSANCVATQSIVNIANRWKSRSLIYMSSLPLIGQPTQLPVTETHPVKPQTQYHISKYFGEKIILGNLHSSIKVAIFRITSPIGKELPKDKFLSYLVHYSILGLPIALHGTGSRTQNYLDLRDLAEAVSSFLFSSQCTREVFNIAGSDSISNICLAELCLNHLNSSSNILLSGLPDPDDHLCWQVSIDKARELLGYSPKYTFPDMIDLIAAEMIYQ